LSGDLTCYVWGQMKIYRRLPDTTPCPRKNYNTVYVAITLADNDGF